MPSLPSFFCRFPRAKKEEAHPRMILLQALHILGPRTDLSRQEPNRKENRGPWVTLGFERKKVTLQADLHLPIVLQKPSQHLQRLHRLIVRDHCEVRAQNHQTQPASAQAQFDASLLSSLLPPSPSFPHSRSVGRSTEVTHYAQLL